MTNLSRRMRRLRFLVIILMVVGTTVMLTIPSTGTNSEENFVNTKHIVDVSSTDEDVSDTEENMEWEELVAISIEALSVKEGPKPETTKEEIIKIASELCEEYDFPLNVFLGLINQESTFRIDAYNKDGSYGLCQINKVNHGWIKEELGITNFYDPKSNMEAGLFILTHYEKTYNPDSIHMLLMMYNMGPNRAKDFFNDGIFSSNYSNDIVNYATNLHAQQ